MKNKIIIMIGLFIFPFCLAAQSTLDIKGTVLDKIAREGLPYATVALLDAGKKVMSGTTTDEHGSFQLSAKTSDTFYIKVQYVGFQSLDTLFAAKKGNTIFNVMLLLAPQTSALREVTIRAEKATGSVQMDKQTFDVAKLGNTTAGTGLDVLQRLPSVTINAEGKILMRGNAEFLVTINGKFTNQTAADVLAQLPANTIENIEIISSPSASLDAEGKAGIINIVTKKNIVEGWGIVANANGSNQDRYGGDCTFYHANANFNNDPVAISGGWQLVRCAYLKFQHLNFEGNTTHPGRLLSIDNGGSCTTQSQFIMVDSCSFSKTTDPAASVAFKFAGVDHFEVTHCLFRDIPACEAMSFNTCHDGVIRGNRFENCLSGGHIKGGSSDITMERNLFIHASQAPWVAYELGGDTGAQFYCPEDHFEVKNLHFFSNIIIGGYRGLALSSARDCKIINNTFYNCGQATMRFLTTSTLYPALFGNQVENNLFAFGASAYFNGGTQPANSVTFSNNLYYSILNPTFNGPYWDSPALDAIKDPNPLNDGSNTPMFVNGPGNDFHLHAGSPAIGSGKTQTEPKTDFFGLPFSVKTRAIGAIEVKNSTNIHQAVENGASDPIVIFPNPATDNVEVYTSGGRGLIEIWNLFGLKVLESQFGQRIPIGHLPSGVYYLKVGAAVYPLVKQ